jgi:hypothetical protein
MQAEEMRIIGLFFNAAPFNSCVKYTDGDAQMKYGTRMKKELILLFGRKSDSGHQLPSALAANYV